MLMAIDSFPGQKFLRQTATALELEYHEWNEHVLREHPM